MRKRSPLGLLAVAGLVVSACQATEDLPASEAVPAEESVSTPEADMSGEIDSSKDTKPASEDGAATRAADRGPVLTPADGLVRPGGPVNRPVPGLAGAEPWPELQPEDVAGDWQLELTGGFAVCTLRLGALNPAGSGALSSEGACPFGPRTPVRWRYHSGLGQIAMLDETGATVMTAHRRGPRLFTLYSPGVGQMKLTPKA